METTKDHLIRCCNVIDFPNTRSEWIEVFEKEYANSGDNKSIIDEVVNDDDSVLAGLTNASILVKVMPMPLGVQMIDVVVFVLYLWWKKNVKNEFPEEL